MTGKKTIRVNIDPLRVAQWLAQGILESNNNRVWRDEGWKETIVLFAQHAIALDHQGKWEELESFIDNESYRRF